MPIAAVKEVTRSWMLGSVVCDVWVKIDLLCCTASILHLVAIGLDRYWAITNCKLMILLIINVLLSRFFRFSVETNMHSSSYKISFTKEQNDTLI